MVPSNELNMIVKYWIKMKINSNENMDVFIKIINNYHTINYNASLIKIINNKSYHNIYYAHQS